jgi:hypothetical protein
MMNNYVPKCLFGPFERFSSVFLREYWLLHKTAVATVEQKQKLFEATVALALYKVLGRVPQDSELLQVSRLARRLCRVLPGLH